MDSDPGNLPPELGNLTLETLQATLQMVEELEILQEILPFYPSGSRDMSEFKLAVIRAIQVCFRERSTQSMQQEDIDMAIKFATKGMQLTPDNDSDGAEWLSELGLLYYLRFKRLGDLEDLGRAIEFMERGTWNSPLGCPSKPAQLNNLGASYQSLFQCLGRLDDLDKSFWCMDQAVILTPDSHPGRPARLNNLGNSYQLLFESLGRLDDLNKSVNCREQAVTLTPDGHPDKPAQLNNLGISYGLLFERLGLLDDLDKSVNCQERAVMLTPDGHPDKPSRLNNLGGSYRLLFERLGRLDDLDKSVNYREQAVMLTPDGHPDKPTRLNNLGNSYRLLFLRLGRLDGLRNSVNCKEKAVALTPDGHPDKPGQLTNLGSSYQLLFEHLGRLDYLEKSVFCQEQAAILTPHGHPHRPGLLTNLGLSYMLRFQYLDRLEDANLAAGCFSQAERLTPDGHPDKSVQLNALGMLHCHMFMRWRVPEHGLAAMDFNRYAALMRTGDPSLRLRASNLWALLSRILDPLSLEGYTHCMMLLPLVVWLGTSVYQRYERLARGVGSLVTEAVAAAISLRRYDLAVEWLEQGRAVVWGQTLQLRTPYNDLYAVRPEMAQELQYVSYQLECASMSNPAEQEFGQDSLSLHNLTWRHRQLAERRERLLASARLLPGLDDFLCPPKASKLMQMGHDRVVVMFSICDEQCDALVVQTATQAITHVPLTRFSGQKAERARDELVDCLGSRGPRGDNNQRRLFYPQYDPDWKGVLALLWHDVAKPVLDHLGITRVLPAENLPHITWCTSGALSFLPLHAAGDYSSPDTVLPNLVISSYTPTISSLSQQASAGGTFSGILAVGHESPIRNLSRLPGTKAELDQVQTWAKSLRFTRLDEEKACADAVLKEIRDHSWVHFACHASQNLADPMKSALHLHDKDLDLVTIARTPLKNAQLAFLFACQTAKGDAALPDESVHLAAGLLMAGYQTVIATMWSISDQDAPLVAGKVYECLLEGGVADSRKAAKALHYAVASLREKIGVDEFARWVPYIHIGR